MKGCDLAMELESACFGLPVVDARIRLVRQGVPWGALHHPLPVGYTRIETDGETYQPVPNGFPAYIIAEEIRTNDDLANPQWEILDLIAVTAERAPRIFTRKGLAWALGAWTVSASIITGEPLRTYRTPFGWLRANREGLCVVDERELWHNMCWLDRIVGQDLDHARHLRQSIRPPEITIPEILVPDLRREEIQHAQR